LVLCSQPGQGSTFSFTLPFTIADPEAQLVNNLATTDTVAEQVRGWRVLLVEDHDVNRQLAQLVLEQYGIVVDTAPNGTVALDLFEHSHYDVILMDIQMPGMSGLDVTTAIRHHPDRARALTPILALTANTLRTDNERYLAVGMNDYLAKPFDEAELLSKMLTVRRTLGPACAPLFDLKGLYQTAHGKLAFVRRVLESFVASTPALLNRLQQSLAIANWLEIAACAHRLKPTLKLLQADELVKASTILEDPDAPDAIRHTFIHLLLDSLPELLVGLRQHLDTLPPSVASSPTPNLSKR
jgi:CheY-like chemotaxis protein